MIRFVPCYLAWDTVSSHGTRVSLCLKKNKQKGGGRECPMLLLGRIKFSFMFLESTYSLSTELES